MRETKFRAWDSRTKSFISWEDAFTDPNILASFFNGFYEPLQYTGLKDKNGVEIYEGDILSWKDYYDQVRHEDVIYDGEYGMFRLSKSSRVLGNTIKSGKSLK